MKLRIKGNSVRLRLLRTEVERLARGGEVSDSTSFGGGDVLRYTVKTSEKANAVVGAFEHGEIAVTMPTDVAKKWAASEDVSIETVQPTGDGEVLELLIEKDFVCHGRVDDPDRDDAYPNPNGPCS